MKSRSAGIGTPVRTAESTLFVVKTTAWRLKKPFGWPRFPRGRLDSGILRAALRMRSGHAGVTFVRNVSEYRYSKVVQ